MFKITFLSIHAPIEETKNTKKDVFYDLLEHVFENVPKHNIKIVLEDCNPNCVCKQMFGAKCLHKNSDGNGIRLITFASSKNTSTRRTTFLHKNMHKQMWMSQDGKTANHIDLILTEK